jgi:hypothetical protein
MTFCGFIVRGGNAFIWGDSERYQGGKPMRYPIEKWRCRRGAGSPPSPPGIRRSPPRSGGSSPAVPRRSRTRFARSPRVCAKPAPENTRVVTRLGRLITVSVAICSWLEMRLVRDALRSLDRSHREMLGRAKHGREFVAFHLGSILPVCIADRHTHGISRARRE